MNKKLIITALLALVALAGQGQNKLMRIGDEESARQKYNTQYLFYYKEKARLLMPKDAEFGVECIPSFSPEWSLTFDSVAHVLIYNEAQESIWYSTYEAMYEKKTKKDRKRERIITERKLRKQPKDYVVSDVKTFTLALNADQAQMLKTIWSNAISTSEQREDGMLDGTTWLYFIGEQRAKAHTGSYYNPYSIVRLTDELVLAVKTGNASRCDSLIGAEFQRVVSNLDIVPNIRE